MAGLRLQQPEEPELSQARVTAAVAYASNDLISDDDRSIAADSWSIKSEYGSTLDDDQRHADASEALSVSAFPATSDYNSDKEEPDAETITSMLGFQSYLDVAYADELVDFREHGHSGEVWFGANVMETVASWTKTLCSDISERHFQNHIDGKSGPVEQINKDVTGWNVLDDSTGNGLLLQELSKLGFSSLTGTDYSEAAVDLAQKLSERDGYTNVKFLVVDVLETKLESKFQLVMDKGTLDAIGLHPDGSIKRVLYWDSVSKLVAPNGILVITSCNSTKDEFDSVLKCVRVLRDDGGDDHPSLSVLTMKAWLGLGRHGEAEKELRGMAAMKEIPEVIWVSVVEAYFQASGAVGAETVKEIFLVLLGKFHVTASSAIRIVRRLAGKEKNFEVCAQFFRLASEFYGVVVIDKAQEYDIMVCKSLILSVTAVVADAMQKQANLLEFCFCFVILRFPQLLLKFQRDPWVSFISK
ncbi:uncharacterized protein LOC124915786 [Impatiens glandulifera]|uniref:uncharacterized protein LOC124915786 n=1 Tax=Impatiens glandulifera TaxID=253017 RepID=UPI001FB04EA0|nr:uncharacterized protein LOC124915786 [Impatiens glandulifera]